MIISGHNKTFGLNSAQHVLSRPKSVGGIIKTRLKDWAGCALSENHIHTLVELTRRAIVGHSHACHIPQPFGSTTTNTTTQTAGNLIQTVVWWW